MTTVRRWTGLEAKLLREALRLSVRDFAAYLGVGMRTVNKWEARLADITLRPHMQEVLDTALSRASDEAQARFAAAVPTSTPAAEDSQPLATAPMLGGLLPVVVNGRLVFVPFDVGALVTNSLGAVLHELRHVTSSSDAGYSVDYSEAGAQSAGPALPGETDSAILCRGRQELSEADEAMIRREVLDLIGTAGALLVTQFGGPHIDWERLEYFSNGTSRLDPATIDDLAQLNDHLWHVFVTAKRKRSALPLVRKQLYLLTGALQRSHGEDAHKRLCVLVGDLFQLAGEVFFDGNQYTHASHCYSLATAASKEANAYDLWACAMTRHAFIGIYEQQFDKSAHMLELAANLARNGDSSLSTTQWIHVVRAQLLAGLGKLDECRRALDGAEAVNLLSGRVHTGGWLRFDGSRLAEERGACYVELRRPDLAEVALTTALSQDLSPRRRGSVLIDLAMIGVQCGDPERLVMYADAALDTARQTGSGVICRKLQVLQERLSSFLGDRHVRHLSEHITTVTRISAS
ncbi:MAG: helix-turn-helix domain-containing protein [Pseudonocardiaceae bacterium]